MSFLPTNEYLRSIVANMYGLDETNVHAIDAIIAELKKQTEESANEYNRGSYGG